MMTSFMAAAGAPERPQSTFWGSQVLYVVYCFFCVIVLSSYTANLTSFLAVRRADEGIEGLQDVLLKSGLIAVNPNGSTASYFATSQDSIAKRLRGSIWYCETVGKCVEAVRQGNALAFVSDSSALEYQAMQSPCNLAVVGKAFGPGNLVIGLQKNSSLLPQFNAALQDFIEDGTLSELRRSWFDKLNECGELDGQLDNSRLTISQMLGVFVILAIGILVAFATGTVENLKWDRTNTTTAGFFEFYSGEMGYGNQQNKNSSLDQQPLGDGRPCAMLWLPVPPAGSRLQPA
ncbi:hypothetical protein Vafri_17470 [Volvox africanus]|uniref:Ionotropic glutamate receptor C-terminal domain-containing protein n=1 Tax=Volvox africanus TaxID=51714 RepID=A0A8J4F7Q3_9CHLO|nr:hypothetical protein Vafri_17470 [Volvox africanus]